MTDTQTQRLSAVNEFIRVISSCGRGFFQDRSSEFVAEMQLDERGRVWFVDDYTKAKIYTHYNGRWKQFSHGGTLRDLIRVFREHIKKGTQIHHRYFQASQLSGGQHPWAYPEDALARLQAEGVRLGLIATPKT